MVYSRNTGAGTKQGPGAILYRNVHIAVKGKGRTSCNVSSVPDPVVKWVGNPLVTSPVPPQVPVLCSMKMLQDVYHNSLNVIGLSHCALASKPQSLTLCQWPRKD